MAFFTLQTCFARGRKCGQGALERYNLPNQISVRSAKMTDKSIDRNDAGAQYEALRDRIAQIVFENVGYSGDDLCCQNAATEIIAALPSILPSMVAPLVWSNTGVGIKSNFGGTRYYIRCAGLKAHLEIDADLYGKSHFGFHLSYDEAKAAANAHHVAQIMSAFATPEETA